MEFFVGNMRKNSTEIIKDMKLNLNLVTNIKNLNGNRF